MKDYNFLNEKYAGVDKICTINGLLMAQAICSRKLIEGHNEGILEVMGNIAKAIESIKDD